MTSPYHQPFDSSGNNGHHQQPGYQHPQQPMQQPGYPQPHPQQPMYQQPMQQQPMYQPMQQPGYGHQAPPKSKMAAALLAFFLGVFGVHNFYLGYTTRGMWQLALNIGGWLTTLLLIGFFALFILGAWVIIDLILILVGGGRYATDARGIPLQ